LESVFPWGSFVAPFVHQINKGLIIILTVGAGSGEEDTLNFPKRKGAPLL